MTKVVTKSGSVYLFDKEKMTFSRVNSNDLANVLMPGPEIEGQLMRWPRIEVGAPLYLLVRLTKPSTEETSIRSTAVVSIEEDQVTEAA